MKREGYGFTLVELLVVIGIVLIVAALIYPVTFAALGKARRTQCVSNMRQLYVASQLYVQDVESPTTVPARIGSMAPYVSDKSVFTCPDEHYLVRSSSGWPEEIFKPNPHWSSFRVSYAYVRSYEPAVQDSLWQRIDALPNLGIFSCPWHGTVLDFPRQDPPAFVGPRQDGPILRICTDGHLFVWPKRWRPRMWWSVQDAFYYPTTIQQVMDLP